MSAFPNKYRSYIRQAQQADNYFGFDVRGLARIEPLLRFLHRDWWKVQTSGFDSLPESGPAVIVGNASGLVPWTALMLIYTLMSNEKNCRHVNVLMDMDYIDDERIYAYLVEIGFVPWSSANVKRLLDRGELVAMFPEGSDAAGKSISMRNRLSEFDWTKFLPVIEKGVKIYPLVTLGCDECSPTFFNLETLSKALNLKAFPVSPFFPWLPFPFNLASLPIGWTMKILPPTEYSVGKKRDAIQECARQQAEFSEGEIQAELNRMLRVRHRVF